MLHNPLRGILGRLLASAIVVAGFYLLWSGFVEFNAFKAIPGAALIPTGLYLMVSYRRRQIIQDRDDASPDDFNSEGTR